jgi:hypothetical protein
MIALLLAAQISAEIVRGMPIDVVPPPKSAVVRVVPTEGAGIVRRFPVAKSDCPGAGRMETSLAKPMALYRKGDRPAKPLLDWTDYPDAHGCLVEAAR